MKNIPISILASRFGNIGRKIWLMAQGKDIDTLKLNASPAKSIGHGKVTAPNLRNQYDIKKILHHMSEKVAKRMRINNYESNIFFIGIKIESGWITKKIKISEYTSSGANIFQISLKLLDTIILQSGIYQVQITAIKPRPINLQRTIFSLEMQTKQRLDYAVDKINHKFGEKTLKLARLLKEFESPDVISPSWRPKGYKRSV